MNPLITLITFRKIGLTLIFTIFYLFAVGQQSFNFRQISTQNGLSSNEINAIVEDKDGLIWFATPDGLNKYDGSNVVVYRHNDQDPKSLPGNEVYALYKDNGNKLWIGTSNGLCYYDDQKDVFVRNNAFVTLPVRSIYSDHRGNLWVGSYGDLRIVDAKTGNITLVEAPPAAKRQERVWCILSLFEDRDGHMWIGSQVGAFRYDYRDGRITSFVHNEADPSSLSNNYITSVIQDKTGRIWLGSLDGLNLLNKDGHSFRSFRLSEKSDQNQHGNIIHAITAGDHDNLWIGTEDGIRIFNTQTTYVRPVVPDNRNLFSLKSSLIKTVYRSHDGIYWIGLEHGGVNTLNNKLPLFDYQPASAFERRSLSLPIVTSFAQSRTGEFFVGTVGGGLQIFNQLSKTFRSCYFSQELKTPLPVLSLKRAKNGILWIGTHENGLFKYDPGTGNYQHFLSENDTYSISENVIYALEEDHAGNIWVGTNGKGIKIFDPVSNRFIASYGKIEGNGNKDVLPLNGFIRAISEKANHEVWIGSYGSGVAIYHPEDKKFNAYTRANSNLVNNHVLSILHDRKGTTWVGTNGGLCRFDVKKRDFITVIDKECLLKRMIFSILEDDSGLLWLSSNLGIVAFNPATGTAKVYNGNNGVLDGPFFVGAGLKTKDGDLFFGGEFGFNYFNPKAIPIDKNTSPVRFNELKVANNIVLPGKNAPINVQINSAKAIILKQGQNFSVSYVAVNYGNPSQTQYAYKLEGFDKDWIAAGSLKTAQYTNLDPGEYVLKVKASNSEGVWSDICKSVVIKVMPPWWRTTWAYILYVCFLLALLYLHRRNSIRKLRLEFEMEKEKLRVQELVEREKREAQRLRDLDSLKIKFLTNISHEFRTPISLIISPVEQMIISLKEGSLFNQAKLIQRNAQRLLNLVNQLLDFRKLEEHELKLDLNPGDLIGFIREATESFNDLAENKNIDLNFSSDLDCIPAFFDHDKVERVLFNLLSNAFKFSEEGGKIDVQLIFLNEYDQGKDSLLVRIRDTGIGIPPEIQANIFERFFRSESEKNARGSGIGLSITREFIALHGGQIEVESVPGQGATFSFTLPVIPDRAVEIIGGIREEDANSWVKNDLQGGLELSEDRPQILLVEDDEDLRFYLKDNLKCHFRIIEAANGKEGWQKALANHPSLIVSDVTMPYMNGMELTKKIVADKRTCHIPVILLTAIGDEDGELTGIQAGASDYLNKPFNFELLNAKIRNLLNLNLNYKTTYSRQIQIKGSTIEVVSDRVKFLTDVLQYIEDNLNNQELNVQELSNSIGMSRGTLYRKILEYTGMKPVEYIRHIKLEKAAQLLEKSDYNVSQIAYMTGFTTPAYFARMFKAKYNMVPTEFISSKRSIV